MSEEALKQAKRHADERKAIKDAYDTLDMLVADAEDDGYLYASEAVRALETLYDALAGCHLIGPLTCPTSLRNTPPRPSRLDTCPVSCKGARHE